MNSTAGTRGIHRMHRNRALTGGAALLGLLACSSPRLASVDVPSAPRETQRRYAITEVRVFDGAAALPAQDVLVEGGRIAALGPTGSLALPADAEVISGQGRTLLPGLIDMHVHFFSPGSAPWAPVLTSGEALAETFLYAGVTSALVASSTDADHKLNVRAEDGRALAPRLSLAGPGLTAPDGHPLPFIKALTPGILHGMIERGQPVADTPEQARAEVRKVFDALHPPFYKLFVDSLPDSAPKIKPEVLAAAVEEARALGMRPIAHVGATEDMLLGASLGIPLFMHVPYKDLLTDAQVDLVKQSGAAFVPTLRIFSSITEGMEGRFSPLDRELLPSDILQAFLEKPENFAPPLLLELEPLSKAYVANARANTQKLIAAGVPYFPGTDTGVPGIFPGGGLHTELDALVSLGLSPAEVLTRATREAGRFLDPAGERGEIAVGRRADLLLVKGNPDEDIQAIHQIEAVFFDGTRLQRHPTPPR